MNYNEFFRIATLAICGNLQIEQAMCNCIGAIRDFIPIDRMFLQLYEPDIGAMRTMAIANIKVGEKVDLLTPIPKAMRDMLKRRLHNLNLDKATIEKPEINPIAGEMLRYHGIEGWSLLRMSLFTDRGRLGGVILSAEGPNRYNEEHVELLTMLKEPFAIALANTMEHREVERLRERLADDNQFLQRELHRISGNEIVGSDFGLRSVMRMMRQVAPTESPVLLTGETGVGKDVVANAIHFSSTRRDGPFIAVNCGAIPETLLDSELFGHEKGSFSGALTQKRGRFERAHRGTIFLDEIGEMPLSAQVRLLRVIQNREIERVGGTERIPVDIRILVATNRDLKNLVHTGRFREDLWFRINVFPIEIPPLRERTCDIPALVQHFVEHKARELKLGKTPELAPGAIDDLIAYPWPGNVRELENLIERAMILYRDEPLRFNLSSPSTEILKTETSIDEDKNTDKNLLSLEAVEEQHIRRALNMSNWKIHGKVGAGELLGINPNTLRHRMRKHGIPFKKSTK